VWLVAAAAVLAAGTAAAAAWRATRAPAPTRLPAPAVEPRAAAPSTAPADTEADAAPPPAPPSVEDEPVLVFDLDDTPVRRPRAPAPANRDAQDLLARANAARGRRAWADADGLYQQVAKKYPKTAAAHVALTASGALHLEHLGDPRGARALFTRAIAADPTGPLAGEARWGLARAARALGDTDGERAALDELLRKHPDSPHRDRAKARLAELR
jgi:tetratricopeptide (TPR) repeat protein